MKREVILIYVYIFLQIDDVGHEPYPPASLGKLTFNIFVYRGREGRREPGGREKKKKKRDGA